MKLSKKKKKFLILNFLLYPFNFFGCQNKKKEKKNILSKTWGWRIEETEAPIVTLFIQFNSLNHELSITLCLPLRNFCAFRRRLCELRCVSFHPRRGRRRWLLPPRRGRRHSGSAAARSVRRGANLRHQPQVRAGDAGLGLDGGARTRFSVACS